MQSSISDTRFRQVHSLVAHAIETRYRIAIVIGDVAPPFTGDLDGSEIRVDAKLDTEAMLFTLAHLFGHTVQWNISEDARRVGMSLPNNPSDAWLAKLRDYELEAGRYSLQLFHDVGVRDLDQWISDFSACDWSYLEHFYRTGEKLLFRQFWREGTPLISPRPIPAFQPRKWIFRNAGIVI